MTTLRTRDDDLDWLSDAFIEVGMRHREPQSIVWALLALGGCGGSANGPVDRMPGPALEHAPRITSVPPTTADHNREYRYVVEADDPDRDEVSITASGPPWLRFDADSSLLHGEAGWDNLGPAPVSVRATDGVETTTQQFVVDVVVGEIDCGAEFGDPTDSPYILPFPTGRTYTLFQGYCPPNPNWGHHNWFAFDFDLAIGDTIVAARGGVVSTVVESYYDGNGVLGANVVYIRPGDGTVNAYVHLTHGGALVQVGDTVEQGDPIGLAGNTGLSSGPHLHFAVLGHGGYTREYSLPVNFSNSVGPWNEHDGPVQGAAYTALPPHP